MRILFGSTVPVTLDSFMRGQLAWIAAQGHEVHVVTSPGPELDRIAARESVRVHAVSMEREISVGADLRALCALLQTIRGIRPDVTVVGTPKAGLLGGLAAWAARVPRRVYLMRGARFEGVTGGKGAVLRATERLSCWTAHTVIAVSPSLAALARSTEVVPQEKLAVVASGSSNGVDVDRFHPPTPEERAKARDRWGIARDEVAIAFVGRLNTDKGADLLGQALRSAEFQHGDRALVLVAGPDEGAAAELDSVPVEVRLLGPVDDIAGLLHACDFLVLPTQREGFPNVVLEAAASGLPVVTTDATGAVDSVVDGVTGFVVPKRDHRALAVAMHRLVSDAELRRTLGVAGRRRAVSDFANHRVWRGMLEAYLGLDHRALEDDVETSVGSADVR